MAVVLDLVSIKVSAGAGGKSTVERTYSVVFSGSYSASGTTGEPLDFTNTTTFTNTPWLPRPRFARNPTEYAVLNSPEGYVLKIEPGSALATGWGLRVFWTGIGDSAVLAELANGAYAAGIKAAVGIRVMFAEPSA